jgi:hypothetical protein
MHGREMYTVLVGRKTIPGQHRRKWEDNIKTGLKYTGRVQTEYHTKYR